MPLKSTIIQNIYHNVNIFVMYNQESRAFWNIIPKYTLYTNIYQNINIKKSLESKPFLKTIPKFLYIQISIAM